MHQLLLVHADRHHFVYEPTDASGADIGVDGIAREGLPGHDGAVAFRFEWQRPELDRRASPRAKSIRHWILVTPCDLEPQDREWLGLSVHHWGQAKIEELLHECPALLARYYPHAARRLLDGFDGTDFRELGRSYRAQVAIAHGRLNTIGLPPETLRERDNRAD